MTSTLSNNSDVLGMKSVNQHVGALIASLGGFALGVALGWNSNAGEILRNNSDATGSEIGLVGGILNVGASIGVLLVPFILRNFTRTFTMIATIPVFIIGWTLICFGGQKILILIFGRMICGICGGLFCLLTPIYIAEIADKEIRERLLTFFHLLINCGIMYAFLIAHIFDGNETIWRYSLVCAITCLTVALVLLLPESPLYYLRQNDELKAAESFRWYHGRNYNVEEETELKRLALVSRTKKITLKMLQNRKVLRSFLTCFGVMLIQQLCGINTMIAHALTLFNTGGSGELTGSEQTLVVGAVQIVSCLLAAVLIGVVGRRILLTVSSTLMGLFLILLGYFFNLQEIDPEYDDIYSWMPPTWSALFFAAYNIGLGPISWSILGDTFPIEIKVTAAAIATSFSWLVSLIAMMTFGEMIIAFGVPRIMWFFAGFCWLGAVFFALVVKDAGGKSLAEIQEDFCIDNSQPNGSIVEET